MNDERDAEAALRRRFTRIYEANHAALAAYALRRAATPEDAADVVAETFAVAWRRIGQVPRGHEGRLWLFGAARKVLANQRRGDRRRARLSLRLAAQPPSAAPGVEERAGDGDRVRSALARLTAPQRDLLGLVAWEGLSTAELATVLGCTENAAKIRLHRARRALQAQLDRGEEPIPAKPMSLDGHEPIARRAPSALPGETR